MKRLYYTMLILLILLSIGTAYYRIAEGWSYVDSFYFSTMTVTTIGFGDLAPTHDASKIFTSFYAMFGIGIMLYILSSVIGVFVFRQQSRLDRFFSNHPLRHHEVIAKQEKVIVDQKKTLEKQEKVIEQHQKALKTHEKELKKIAKKIDKK